LTAQGLGANATMATPATCPTAQDQHMLRTAGDSKQQQKTQRAQGA